MTTTQSTTTGIINATDIYGITTPSVQTAPIDKFSESISIRHFMIDLSFRYPDLYKQSQQVWAYFFTDKSCQNVHNDTYDKDYLIVRPELVTFAWLDSSNKRITKSVRKGLEVYGDYGVKFETHIPMKEWDKDNKRYTNVVRTDKDGKVIYKRDREIKREMKVNHLRINSEVIRQLIKHSKLDLGSEIEYHQWDIVGVNEKRSDSLFMMKSYYAEVEQFELVKDKIAVKEDEDLTIDLADV